MANKHKAKTAGKIIIIVLSLAILFFLLLPFLDSPAASGGAGGKKAVPQIFTSNPLSDLVQKVFAMFKRDSQKAPSYSNGMTEEMLASLSPEEQQKYALQRAEEEGKNFEYSTEVDASYAYGEAGMVNENGEWILVRQTAPESANLGMHEINTRESAYDRHVRQERAARYTGKAGADAGPAIPDSKWARLWKPIKAFFTGEDEADTVQEATGENAYLLASAGTGLGKDSYKQGSTYRRGKSANISASEWELGNGEASLEDIFNPTRAFDDMAESYTKLARETLTPQQAQKFLEQTQKIIDDTKRKQFRATNELLWKKMAQGEQEEERNFVAETIVRDCMQNKTINSLYRSPGASSCQDPTISGETLKKNLDPQEELQKNNQLASENMKRMHGELAAIDENFAKNPIPMMVILGKADSEKLQELLEPSNKYEKKYDEFGEPISEENMTEEMLASLSPEEQQKYALQRKEEAEEEARMKINQEFVNYILEKQGCSNSNPCYWVGGEYLGDNPELRHTVQSSGMEYSGDPLNVISPLFTDFFTQKIKTAETEEEVDRLLEYQQTGGVGLAYVPYNAENMETLNQENRRNPKVYYIPSPANALAMKEVLPNALRIVYDETKDSKILDAANEVDFTERGKQLHKQILKRNAEVHHTAHETGLIQQAHQKCAQLYLKYHSENVQEEMAESSGSSMDDIMAL